MSEGGSELTPEQLEENRRFLEKLEADAAVRQKFGHYVDEFRLAAGDQARIDAIKAQARAEGVPDDHIENFAWAGRARLSEGPERMNVGIRVEAATPDQLDEYRQALVIPKTRIPAWKEAISAGAAKFLIGHDAERGPVGWLVLETAGPTEEAVVEELGGQIPWISPVFVPGENARAGVGRRLIYEAVEAARQLPGSPRLIGAAVQPSNAPAMKDFEALGFEPRSVMGQATFVAKGTSAMREDLATQLMVKELGSLD